MRHFLKYCILLFSVNLFAQSDQIDSLILLKKNNQLQIKSLRDQIKKINKQIVDLERIISSGADSKRKLISRVEEKKRQDSTSIKETRKQDSIALASMPNVKWVTNSNLIYSIMDIPSSMGHPIFMSTGKSSLLGVIDYEKSFWVVVWGKGLGYIYYTQVNENKEMVELRTKIREKKYSEERKAISEKQAWVMENVVMQTPWEPLKFIERLGQYEELTLINGNPKIIKVYYFKEADITFFVNELKDNVTTWRIGKDNRLL